VNGDVLAAPEDVARFEIIGAKNQARHLGPAGADQASEPEDLAAVQLKADIPDRASAIEPADLEDHFRAGLLGYFWRRFEDGPADHHRDDAIDRRLVG